MSAPDKNIHEQPQARRLRSVDLRSVASGRIEFLGIDVPSLVPAAKTIGVFAFPAPVSPDKGLAELIAEAVVARLHAIGAAVSVSGASVTTTTITANSMSALVPDVPVVPVPVLDEPPPILLSTIAAAKLLGCSVKAIYHRVNARQIPSSCIVRSGRRILFHRAKLLDAMERRAGR